MSKVTATSGNYAPVIKGNASGDYDDSAAAGLFAALFGGMQQAEIDSDADAAQTQSNS